MSIKSQEITKNFEQELFALLKKYNAEILLQETSKSTFKKSNEIVVNFDWSSELYDETGSGNIPQLVLGTYAN